MLFRCNTFLNKNLFYEKQNALINNKKKAIYKIIKLIFISLLINSNYIIKNIIYQNKKIFSDKWIIITTENLSKFNLISLLKNIEWNIVLIDTNKINQDDIWKKYNNSKNLFYLSMKDQLNLGYQTIKYIGNVSYHRKNIGYLYAIQHGAKEIYEIDNKIISNFQNLNWIFNKTIYERITICNNNNFQMINPYSYFGLNDIWPRGFRLKDLNKDDNHTFFNLASTQINLNPLIYQGLINGIPDIDSIFLMTRIQRNIKFDIKFSKNYPLLYLPGNYVPINSKNTKYLYDIFPILALPITLNEQLSDIYRGYIMQCYAWSINGVLIYVSSDSYNTIYLNKFFFEEEKKLYLQLDNLLTILIVFN